MGGKTERRGGEMERQEPSCQLLQPSQPRVSHVSEEAISDISAPFEAMWKRRTTKLDPANPRNHKI